MDRFTAITVFRRVIELNGFSAAARDLGVSNAAVSKIIKELEAELGAQLITRTTRSLSLTDTGRSYYERVTRLLDDMNEADEEVRSSSLTPRGQLRVSAPMSLGLLLLASHFARFAALYPELSVEVDFRDDYVDVVEGGFDLAIRGGALQDSSLRARKLIELDRVLCASPEYLGQRPELTKPGDIKDHDCLIYSLSQSPNRWALQSGGHAETVQVCGRYRVNSSLAITSAAIEGLGLAFIPRLYVEKALKDGQLVKVLPNWSGSPQALYGIYPGHRETSRKLRLFIDFLVEALSQE